MRSGLAITRRSLLCAAGTALVPTWRGARREGEAAVALDCAQQADGIHYDGDQLIVQRDCDGADTAQREGMYWLGQWVRANMLGIPPYGATRAVTFPQVMVRLEEGQSGRFRRHPTQTRLIGEGAFRGPINSPKTTSRDQVVPLIAAMGVHRDFVRLDRFRNTLREDHYLINKDVMLLCEEFIKRARDVDLLFDGVVDAAILEEAVSVRCSQAARDMDDVGDDLNLIVQLLLTAVRRGDRVGGTRRRYARERPPNFGVYLTRYRQEFPNDFGADPDTMRRRIETGIKTGGWRPDCSSVYGALKWYCRAESGGNPGLAEMYRPILDKYLA